MTNKIQKIRRKIDATDKKFLKILAKRFLLAKKLVPLKAESSIEDLSREKEVLANWLKFAEEIGLSSDLINQILPLILAESKNIQKK